MAEHRNRFSQRPHSHPPSSEHDRMLHVVSKGKQTQLVACTHRGACSGCMQHLRCQHLAGSTGIRCACDGNDSQTCEAQQGWQQGARASRERATDGGQQRQRLPSYAATAASNLSRWVDINQCVEAGRRRAKQPDGTQKVCA